MRNAGLTEFLDNDLFMAYCLRADCFILSMLAWSLKKGNNTCCWIVRDQIPVILKGKETRPEILQNSVLYKFAAVIVRRDDAVIYIINKFAFYLLFTFFTKFISSF